SAEALSPTAGGGAARDGARTLDRQARRRFARRRAAARTGRRRSRPQGQRSLLARRRSSAFPRSASTGEPHYFALAFGQSPAGSVDGRSSAALSASPRAL